MSEDYNKVINVFVAKYRANISIVKDREHLKEVVYVIVIGNMWLREIDQMRSEQMIGHVETFAENNSAINKYYLSDYGMDVIEAYAIL